MLNIREQSWEIKKGCDGRMMCIRAIQLLNSTGYSSVFIDQFMSGKFKEK